MSKPVWITPKGFLRTSTENVFTTFSVSASGTSISYSLINGELPAGLSLSNTGTFLGTPTTVIDVTSSTFTVRAANTSGSTDRTFRIDITGPDNPVWITSPGILNIGPAGQNYVVQGQYINFQLLASTDVETLNYNLISGDLPKSLELNQDGVISGFVTDFVAQGSKNYDFIVAANNGVSQTTSSFRIILFRTLQNDIIPLQWLNGTDLGIVKQNQNFIKKLPLHDPRPTVGTLTFALTTGNLPETLNLDSSNGIISGFIFTQDDIDQTYNFSVSATKNINNNTTATTQTFQLSVLGLLNPSLSWVTTGSLGSVIIGKPVTLQVETISKDSIQSSKYKIKSGSLPPGVTLNLDGLIAGVVPINTATSAETITYNFEINGLDNNNNILSTGTFSITTIQSTSTEFTQIYCRPFLSLEKRNLYRELTGNDEIFEPEWIYRASDSNFGIKHDIKIIVDFGIEVQYLYDYNKILEDRFYKRKFQVSDLKVTPYTNTQGEQIYELVYLELLDEYGNDLSKQMNARDADLTLSILYSPITSSTFTVTSTSTFYNTIKEIRNSIREEISFTDDLNPDFLDTWALTNNTSTRYFVYVPICYAKPGKGSLIRNRIIKNGFDFKVFDIEIDRIIVEKVSR